MITIINLLSGPLAAKFRESCSDILVRFLGGDLTLIDQIKANNNIQQQLPDNHPAKIFGEAVKNNNFEAILSSMDIDPINLKLVLDLIKKSKTVNISKYLNQHAIYLCVTLLVSDKENKIIIKIGYTADILKRLSSLNTEYKCKMLICGIGSIKSEQHEKEFHKVLKLRFPELIYDTTIDTVEKDELYYYDDRIINEFNSLFEEINKKSDKDFR